MAAWETLPALNDRVKNIALASPPPGDTHFLAHDRGGHVDHHVLYFGTDAESLAALRKADVIFLGNSRLMFAMQSRVLAPFFAAQGGRISHLDGVSVDFDDWHFNVRPSNTEPLLRLNLEALDEQTMERRRDEVLELIRS